MKIVELQAVIFDIRYRRGYQVCQSYDARDHCDDSGEEAEDVGNAGEAVVHVGGDLECSRLCPLPSYHK